MKKRQPSYKSRKKHQPRLMPFKELFIQQLN